MKFVGFHRALAAGIHRTGTENSIWTTAVSANSLVSDIVINFACPQGFILLRADSVSLDHFKLHA